MDYQLRKYIMDKFFNFPKGQPDPQASSQSQFASYANQRRVLELQSHLGNASSPPAPGPTPKLVLNNELQRHGLPSAVYQTRRVAGPDHAPLFVAGLMTCDHFECGTGNSIQAAEHDAAARMLRWAHRNDAARSQLNGSHGEWTGTDDVVYSVLSPNYSFTVVCPVTDDNSDLTSSFRCVDNVVPGINGASGPGVVTAHWTLPMGFYPPVAANGSLQLQLQLQSTDVWTTMLEFKDYGFMQNERTTYLLGSFPDPDGSFYPGAVTPRLRLLYTGTDTFAAYDVCLLLTVTLTGAVDIASGSVMDVNVVGFTAQTGPVWVSDVQSRAAVVTYPPAASAPAAPVQKRQTGVDLVNQRKQNRAMHSANGNTKVGSSFSVVSARQAVLDSEGYDFGNYDDGFDCSDDMVASVPVVPTGTVAPCNEPSELFLIHEQNRARTCPPRATFRSVTELDSYIRFALARDTSAFNQFAVLRLLKDCTDEEALISAVPEVPDSEVDAGERTLERIAKAKAAGARTAKSTTPSDARKAGAAAKKEAKPEARVDRDNTLLRLSKTLHSTELFARWLVRRDPARAWAQQVWDYCHYEMGRSPVHEAYVTARLSGVDCHAEFRSYVPLVHALSSSVNDPLFQEWVDTFVITNPNRRTTACSSENKNSQLNGSHGEYTGTDDVEATWSVSRKTRNKEAHALNGNTTLHVANTMDDVRASPNIWKLPMEGMPSSKPINATREIGAISGIVGPEGSNTALNVGQDNLRMQAVSNANAIVQANVDAPEVMLFPSTLRNGAGAGLVNRNIRTTWLSVSTTNWDADPVSETALALDLKKAFEGSGGIRPGTFTAHGYRADDVNALALASTNSTIPGDCMTVPFLKLMLMTLSKNWKIDPNLLPLGASTKLDSFTQIANPVTGGLTYNTGAVFGEDCGGATSVLPFGANAPGTTGEIYFHQTLASVPANQRANVLTIRAQDLLASESGSPGVNLALLILMWAQGPVGLHRFRTATLDSAGGNAANQDFIPMSDLVRIAGLSTIHVLLPIASASMVAITTQGAANSNLIFQPTSGPTASTAYPVANTALDLSFVDALGLRPVNLAEFMYTWLAEPNSPIDGISLMRFAMRMADVTGRWSDFGAAWELACVLANRYCISDATAAGGGLQYAVNTFPGLDTQDYACFRPMLQTVNFPAPDPGKWTYVLPGVSPLWFTQHVVGAVTSAPRGERNGSRDWIASPYSLQYARYFARQYAANMQVFYRRAGIPAGLWNAIFTQTNYVRVKEVYKRLWLQGNTQPDGTRGHIVAPLGMYLMHAQGRLTPYSPACDKFGYSLYSYRNPPQGGTAAAPGNGIAGVYVAGPAEAINVVPQPLADVWFLLTVIKVPKSMQAWPVPLNRPTGLADGNTSVMAWAAGGKSVPTVADRQARNIGLQSLPNVDDAEVFNGRLALAALNGDAFTTDGNAFAVSIPAVNTIVHQRRVIPDWTLPNYVHSRIVTAATTWFPVVSTTGLNLVVGVTNANGADFMTQVMSGRAFAAAETFVWPDREIMPNTIIGGEVNTDDGMTESYPSTPDALNSEPEPSSS